MKKIFVNVKKAMTKNNLINFLEINKDLDITFLVEEKYLNLKHKRLGSQDYIDIENLLINNIQYALLNHKDEIKTDLRKKEQLINLIQNNIQIILCIGEKIILDNPLEYVLNKIDFFLSDINFSNKDIIIAYEPEWAVDSNKKPALIDIEKIILYIKKHIKLKYNKDMLVIYGGGIDKNNINYLINSQIIDGILVSRYALELYNLNNLLKIDKY